MKPNPMQPLTSRRLRARGFTLVELLVVMAIIGVMAGMVMPQIAKAMEKIRRTACSNNLRQIGLALHAYAQDSDGRYPFTGSVGDSANKHFALLFPRWMNNETVFVCKSAATRGYRADGVSEGSSTGGARTDALKAGENCYAYAFGLGGPNTEDLPLACDQLAEASLSAQRWAKQGFGGNHSDEGGNVLYLDGHVDFLLAGTQGAWPAKKQRLQALASGKFCAPANAERAPDDLAVAQH
ncbi:MAG: type II secretion system protein [Verrucomicrobia bacterium]|nr:type II secretion system protein [Verrucomicrobiota bacterium]